MRADGFEIRRLNPTQEVANKFRMLASAWAGSLHSRTLVPYRAGRRPEDHEMSYLPIAGVETLTNLVASMDEPIERQVLQLDPAFLRRLRFYVISAWSENPGWVHFFRAKGETLRLKRTRKLLLVPSGGAFDELEDDPLVFDPSFDGIVADGYALLANQAAFERALRFVEQASAAALATLDQLLVNVSVANADELRMAASSDVNMIAKLRSITEKLEETQGYADAMTTDALVDFAEDRGIEIDTVEVDGRRQLVFHPDPQRRWRILKLLDDDYLHSALTEIDYEVNSKSPLET